LETTNADITDTCTSAQVTITGPVTRSFEAGTGDKCTAGTAPTRQWAQSISLPAGTYGLEITYSGTVNDQATEPASLASATGVSAALTFFPPTAAFRTTLSGSVVVFDASASAPGAANDPVTRWIWDFGDGTRVDTSQPLVKHTFPASPTTAPTYRVTLQVVDAGQRVSNVVSHAVVGTAVAFTVSKTASGLHVGGSVRPNRAGHPVAVTLARKVGGVFSTLSTRRPTLSSLSRFATSFTRPRAGTCRLRVRYAGDATHLASLSQRIFSC
jgi:PKD repeat protein